MKKETIWIIAIVAVSVIFLAQSFDISRIPGFIIAGGGAGSSVTQIIEPIIWFDGGDTYSLCIARPPVGETWLITGFEDDSGDCSIVKGAYQNYDWVDISSATTDRLFIDNNAYLMCGSYWGRSCNYMTVIGVRV